MAELEERGFEVKYEELSEIAGKIGKVEEA